NIRKVRDIVEEAFLVGRLTQEALEDTGISECETVVICISKVDVSVLTAQVILGMGVPRVICKAESREHGMILEKIGAEVVYPEVETATRLASILLESHSIDLMRLNDDYVLSEIKIPEEMKGCTIKSLNLEKYDLRLIAVEEEPNKTLLEFSSDRVLYHDE
ncbi:MAG: NAD-binding protein, partial [Anaerovoracaceae bacterium]